MKTPPLLLFWIKHFFSSERFINKWLLKHKAVARINMPKDCKLPESVHIEVNDYDLFFLGGEGLVRNYTSNGGEKRKEIKLPYDGWGKSL